MSGLPTRGVWCGARYLGRTRGDVRERLAFLADLGFNLILPNLKDGAGRVCWRSEAVPEATHESYRDFDLPLVLLEEAERVGLRVHAWFIDFFEGGDGAAPATSASTAVPPGAPRVPVGTMPFVIEGNPVPEPATMLAIGAGLAAIAARRRRK